MARIPTPAPESLMDRLTRTIGGRPLDLVWAISVTVVLVGIGIALVAAGGVVGAAIGAAALATVFNDAVREAITDIYARNFWVWRTD
ncbi:hypothetical protein [Halolamina sp.]|uniref:hypothetical protein n=1 Tax=Halolamina sp. TaxID=1940283 RepID=UPI003567FF84